jgi:protein-S-isoprenylcysteine O-methyltransferase Ste14
MVFRAAHGVFAVLLVVTAVVWAGFEVRQSLNHRSGTTHADQGSQYIVRLGVGGGLVGALVLARVVPGAQIEPIELASWLGLVFLWCGAGLRIWSFRTLGTYFTFSVQTSSDQPIITSGPYRLLRHPSYTGFLLGFTGVGFFIGNWLSIAAILAGSMVGLSYRIAVEEKALEAETGDRYRQFAATRKRLIPFVW